MLNLKEFTQGELSLIENGFSPKLAKKRKVKKRNLKIVQQ